VTSTSDGSRPARSQCRRSAAILRSMVSRSARTLQPSPSSAAMRRVRRSPPPPTMTGSGPTGRGYEVVSGRDTRSPVYAFVPAAHSARIVSIPSASASIRSRTGGMRSPVRQVLALPPAGADPDERPAAAEHVERRGRLRHHARRPEGHRRHERAQPQWPVARVREPGKHAERYPWLGDRIPRPPHLRDLDQVVHERDALEASIARGLDGRHQPSGWVVPPRELRYLQDEAEFARPGLLHYRGLVRARGMAGLYRCLASRIVDGDGRDPSPPPRPRRRCRASSRVARRGPSPARAGPARGCAACRSPRQSGTESPPPGGRPPLPRRGTRDAGRPPGRACRSPS